VSNFAKEVWDKLSRIDVSEHADQLPKTGKRPAVSYLPWHSAWTLVKRAFPATTYTHLADIHHPDGTVEVEITVRISSDGSDETFSNARLGVMNNYFAPIEQPTAREVNDARQRCLVKALAFAGLGLNLWSDSIIPVGVLEDPIDMDQMEQLEKLLKSTKSDQKRFLKWCGVEDLSHLPVEKYGSAIGMLQAKARRQANEKKKKEAQK
jgi:hypothetical protein